MSDASAQERVGRTVFMQWFRMVPVVSFSNFARTGLGLTNTAFLGHLADDARYPHAVSTDFLAASSLAYSCIAAVNIILAAGFCAAISVLCSQAFGANDLAMADRWLRVGTLATLAMCVPAGLAYYYSSPAIALVLSRDVCNETCLALIAVYTRELIPALPAWALYSCLACYFQAQNIVLPILGADVFCSVANAVLNYCFIYGVPSLSIPAFGFVGSVYATVVSRILTVVGTVLWFRARNPARFSKYLRGGRRAIAYDEMCQYLSQAVPLSVGGTIEEWQLQVILFMAGALGQTQVAAFSGVMNILVLFSALNYGMMTATSVRVGNYIGEADPKNAKLTIKYASYFSAVVGLCVCGGLILLRNEIGKIYSDDAVVWALTADECWLLGPGYVLLCVFFVCMSALEGQARSTEVAISFFMGAWVVAVPMAYVLAFLHDYGLMGLWYAIVVGYVVVTVLSLYFYCRSDWANIILRAQSLRTHPTALDHTPLLDPSC